MDGYLCKPVKSEELVAAVEQSAATGKAANSAVESPSVPEATRPPDAKHQFPDRDVSPIDLRLAMMRLDGNFKLFRQMAAYFFNDALDILPDIRSAAARGDLETLADKTHWFKGTVLYLGAAAVTSVLDRLESLSRAGDRTGASAAVEALEGEVERLAAALRRFVPEAANGTASPNA
jgi:HPt (histidine-containing phosphotransfer) domain-containing protein